MNRTEFILKLARDLRVINSDSVLLRSALNKSFTKRMIPFRLEEITNLILGEIVEYNTRDKK